MADPRQRHASLHAADLPRPQRDDGPRPRGPRSDAAVLALPRAIPRAGTPPAGPRAGPGSMPGRPSRGSSGPTRARSSSRRGGPSRTTWPSSAWLEPAVTRPRPPIHSGAGSAIWSRARSSIRRSPRPWPGSKPMGLAVDRPAVDASGVADAERMAATIRPETRLATLMLANNETGAIQPVARLAALGQRAGVPVHTDAVQAVGRIPVDFHAPGRRHAGRQRAQVPRPGGGRAAPGPERRPAPRAALRRRPAAGSAAGNGCRTAGRRSCRGPRALAGGGARPDRPLDDAARPLETGLIAALGARPGRPQRAGRTRAPSAPDTQPRLPRPRRRRPPDAARPGRHRRIARLGLRQRLDTALAHPGRHARARRPASLVGPIQPWRHNHQGRNRRRPTPDDRHRSPAGAA